MAWNGNGGRSNGGNRAPLQRVEGVVEKVNDNGPRINGQWFNFSKHASFSVYPEEGDYVVVGVSQGKWINEMEVNEGGQTAPAQAPAQRPQQSNGYAQQGGQRPAPTRESDQERQTSIIRQTCIKAAADILSGSGSSAEEAVEYARIFEAYVTGKAAPRQSNQEPPMRPDEEDEIPF